MLTNTLLPQSSTGVSPDLEVASTVRSFHPLVDCAPRLPAYPLPGRV